MVIRVVGLVLAVLALLLPAVANAQTSTLVGGAKLGINSAVLTVPSAVLGDGERVTRKSGISLGGWVRKDLSEDIGLTVEALFSQKGFGVRIDSTLFGAPFRTRSSARVTYLDLPASLSW